MKTEFIIVMYVCVCLAVTDEEVSTAIEGGARTVDDVTRACSAGGDCGACHEMIASMIGEAAADGRACDGHGTAPRERLVALRTTRAA